VALTRFEPQQPPESEPLVRNPACPMKLHLSSEGSLLVVRVMVRLVPVVSHTNRTDIRVSNIVCLDHRPNGATIGTLVFCHTSSKVRGGIKPIGRCIAEQVNLYSNESLLVARWSSISRLIRFSYSLSESDIIPIDVLRCSRLFTRSR